VRPKPADPIHEGSAWLLGVSCGRPPRRRSRSPAWPRTSTAAALVELFPAQPTAIVVLGALLEITKLVMVA